MHPNTLIEQRRTSEQNEKHTRDRGSVRNMPSDVNRGAGGESEWRCVDARLCNAARNPGEWMNGAHVFLATYDGVAQGIG